MTLESTLARMKQLAEIFALVAAPVLVALIGGFAACNSAKRESNARLVEIAATVLASTPSDSTRALRAWARDILNKHADVKLPSQIDSMALPSISNSGLFTAGSVPGSFKVTATGPGGVTAAANVSVVKATLATTPLPTSALPSAQMPPSAESLVAISVAPAAAVLAPGAAMRFAVTGMTSDGKVIPIEHPHFVVTGGKMDSAGRFVAGTELGPFSLRGIVRTQRRDASGRLRPDSLVTDFQVNIRPKK